MTFWELVGKDPQVRVPAFNLSELLNPAFRTLPQCAAEECPRVPSPVDVLGSLPVCGAGTVVGLTASVVDKNKVLCFSFLPPISKGAWFCQFLTLLKIVI